MIRKITAFVLTITFCSLRAFGQISGNQAYGNDYNNNSRNENINYLVLQGDSAMVISANILLNTPADVYILTLALSQEGKTIKACNDSINIKIGSFRSAVKKLSISEKDIYVDFISQTRIYDYNISGKTAEQFENGFEIKKNLTIRLNTPADFDKLIIIASQHNIYDLVKVDYVINDTRKIYNQMMSIASEIINQKKQTYLQIASFQLLPVSKIYSENFYNLDPKNQYQSYKAYESSDVYGMANADMIKKVQRKTATFYYDGLTESGFDKVINATTPVVGIQFILELKIKFSIQR